MDIQPLKKQILTLATLPDNSDPVTSCYANVRDLGSSAVLR